MAENKIKRIKLLKIDSEKLYEEEIFCYDENKNLTIVGDLFDKYVLGLNMFYNRNKIINVANIGDGFIEDFSEHLIDAYNEKDIECDWFGFNNVEELLKSNQGTLNLLLESTEFSQKIDEISSRIGTLKLNEAISDIVVYPNQRILAFREENNANYTLIKGKQLYGINIKPHQILNNNF